MEHRPTGKTTRMIAQALAAISAQPEKTQYIVVSNQHVRDHCHRLVCDTAQALGWNPEPVRDSGGCVTNFQGTIKLVTLGEAKTFYRGVEAGNIKYDV